MHAGAGLLIYTYTTDPAVNVTGCRFIGNAAGFVSTEALAAYSDSFRVHDDEVKADIALMLRSIGLGNS